MTDEATQQPRHWFRAAARIAVLAIAATATLGAGAVFGPQVMATFASTEQAQVAILFVPLAVLMLSILVEVTRFALREKLPETPAPLASTRHWRPGRGEG